MRDFWQLIVLGGIVLGWTVLIVLFVINIKVDDKSFPLLVAQIAVPVLVFILAMYLFEGRAMSYSNLRTGKPYLLVKRVGVTMALVSSSIDPNDVRLVDKVPTGIEAEDIFIKRPGGKPVKIIRKGEEIS